NYLEKHRLREYLRYRKVEPHVSTEPLITPFAHPATCEIPLQLEDVSGQPAAANEGLHKK
ncbi:hypothetical protein, partial [Pseudomonas sp.]|uniref:hypothetical protein n=1 Tax=Pseudomonas sp. TaxID=306 RepID=UPI002354E763